MVQIEQHVCETRVVTPSSQGHCAKLPHGEQPEALCSFLITMLHSITVA